MTGKKSGRSKKSGLLLKCLLALTIVGLAVLVYFDAWVRTGFEGRRWQLPAQVYARPLALYAGAPLTMDNLQVELALLGYQKKKGDLTPGTYSLDRTNIRIYSRGVDVGTQLLPAQLIELQVENGQIQDLLMPGDEDYWQLEPMRIGGIYPAQHEERQLLQLMDMPEQLREGLLYVEDRHFREHWGVAPFAIVRAAWANLVAGRVVQGGSTITQQLVKNFWLNRERSLSRKLMEAIMAVLVDFHYEKDEILEAYLNEVYLGQAGRRSIHGIGMASQFYFGRPAHQLNLQQSALLIALVKGPAYYNPRRYPERALKRRNLVLSLMAEAGLVSSAQAENAQKKGLGLTKQPLFSANRYPAYMDLVKQQLREQYPEEVLNSEGLQIFTNLDPQMQDAAEKALEKVLQHKDKKGDLQGAVVVTGAESGEVVAIVGGRDVRFPGFNRALDAHRQIGSLVKPFVYLSALMKPEKYSLISSLEDENLVVEFENGDRWQPKNYDKQAHGLVPLMQALAHSYNLATVRLGLDVGLDTVLDTLQKAGLAERPAAYPSVLLGSLSLSPLEVSGLYQHLATSGFSVPARAIRSVSRHDGETLSSYPYEVAQVFKPEEVHLIQYAMQTTAREGTGKSLYRQLPDSLAVAAKTGTTNDGRDSWFTGFSGDYLAVAWVGYDDNRSAHLTGSTGALPVWREMMSKVPQRSLKPVVPDGVQYEWVDVDTGNRTDKDCANARFVPFIKGYTPSDTQSCSAVGRIKGWFDRIF